MLGNESTYLFEVKFRFLCKFLMIKKNRNNTPPTPNIDTKRAATVAPLYAKSQARRASIVIKTIDPNNASIV